MASLLSRSPSVTGYSGKVRDRDYRVTVSHRAWRTRIVELCVDGSVLVADARAAAGQGASNVRITLRGWMTVVATLSAGETSGSEAGPTEIHASTAAFGGAGDVDVHIGGSIVPLLPDAGSESERRDLRRSARPTAYALITASTTALRLLIPLLGLGTLLGLLTAPVKEWLRRHLSPVFDPFFAWLGTLLAPLGRVLSTIGDVIASVFHALFGWLPSLTLPFEVPDWVGSALRIALLVAIAFLATRANLERRRKQREAAEENSEDESPSGSDPDGD